MAISCLFVGIGLLVDGNLGCFHFLAISVNIHVQDFVGHTFIFWDIAENIFKEAYFNKDYTRSLVPGIILRMPSQMVIEKNKYFISTSLAYLVLFFVFKENLEMHNTQRTLFFFFQARLQRGHLLLKQGKLDEAEDDFKKVVSSI